MKKLSIAFVVGQGLSAVVLANPVEETLITGIKTSHTIELAENVELTSDSAQLLKKAPGANFNSNGPVTGIAQLRGMFGSRVNVTVNNQTISAGGPNWMDPPLSYAPSALLESITVYRGIAPVSAGQETLGGAIKAKTWSNSFASNGKTDISGRLRAGKQSINDGSQASALIGVANRNHKAKLALLRESADNAEFKKGEITPTEYERKRADVEYGFQLGAHAFGIEYIRNETGDSGTPALPMDIEYIDSDLTKLSYQFDSSSIKLDSQIYASDIKHGMTNYHFRQAPMMDSMWRRNIADGDNQGFALNFAFASWSVGLDYHDETHNSDIDNPNNPTFFLQNFNQAERTVTGIFTEFSPRFSAKFNAEFGLRINNVEMDSEQVNGTPAMMMPMAQTLRDNFNAADRKKSDNNVDAVAKLYATASNALTFYVGIAQKSRSPSYQERYLWMPMEATAGLADGRTYTGNIDLEPEIAREIETGFDIFTEKFYATPRIFYRSVKDFIQGTPSSNNAAIMVANMMGMSSQPPLEFNNVDAIFYGLDLDWQYKFTDSLSVSGIVNYVRGKRDDIDDNLYRVAPANATSALNFYRTTWGASIESVLYAKQDKVSDTQSEKSSPGYGLINLKGYAKLSENLQLSLGINNLFDKHYYDHLAGYNRVRGSDIVLLDRLPGYGRNAYLQMSYLF